jgi:hypothetical protein
MLKILTISVIVGIFCFALTVAVLSVWRSWQHQHSQQEQKQGTEGATTQRGQTAALIGTKESPEEAIARYNLGLMVFTGLLAAIGIIQIGFLLSADSTARDAADSAKQSTQIANETLIAAQRPWVSVKIESAGPITWPQGFMQIPFKITLTNIGKSPAFNVRHVEIVIVDSEAKSAQYKESESGIKRLADVTQFAANIMPNDSREEIIGYQVQPGDIAKGAKAFTKDGKGPKLIMPVSIGSVRYESHFDKFVHHSDFIYSVGFWDPAKGIIVTAIDPVGDSEIPAERVRILRHYSADGDID